MKNASDAEGKPRLLIVEDEALLALDIDMTLSAAGFTVIGQASDEKEAVSLAFDQRPDIILMDITLAEGNGISAARAITGEMTTCVIFLSGNSDPSTLAAAEALDAGGFINKPYNASHLPKLVMQLYRKYHGGGRL